MAEFVVGQGVQAPLHGHVSQAVLNSLWRLIYFINELTHSFPHNKDTTDCKSQYRRACVLI